MNEEIDIIELLQRVKEGKAPKRIEINNNIYKLYGDDIQFMYRKIDNWNVEKGWFHEEITLDTKIKILDKPIINTADELKKIIKDKDSIFWIGERGLMAIEEAINIIQNKEE